VCANITIKRTEQSLSEYYEFNANVYNMENKKVPIIKLFIIIIQYPRMTFFIHVSFFDG
jgi:hypothetical protein